MLNTKPILKFVIVFFVAYGVLIAIAPAFRTLTGKYLASLGNHFLNSPVIISFFPVHLMTLSRIYVQILHIASSHPNLNLISSGESSQRFINALHGYYVSFGTVKLFLVIFIWLAVTFRKEDLALIEETSS